MEFDQKGRTSVALKELEHEHVVDEARVDLDTLCVNTIRFLAVDAVQKANSGHPGLPMGAAPMAHLLWTRFLKHNPSHPEWFDRDQFVLSAGHGSMLLYALLHLTGYDLPLEQIKHFRQWGSQTPGHPRTRPGTRSGDDNRTSRPGIWQRRRHGDCRGTPGGPLQSSRSYDHQSLHVRNR